MNQCFTFESVYLHTFQFNTSLVATESHFSNITCSGLITTIHWVITQSFTDEAKIFDCKSSSYPSKLDGQEVFHSRSRTEPKHLNTILCIWSSLSRDHQTVTMIIYYCYCLKFSGKWRPNIWCGKINISSNWILQLGCLLKWFVFERHFCICIWNFFWKKHDLMLVFNFVSQNC